MTTNPLDTTALAARLGITRELYAEWFWQHCPKCDSPKLLQHSFTKEVACKNCNSDFMKPETVVWRCTLPSPLSDDPRARLWNDFFMEALGWPHVYQFGEAWAVEDAGRRRWIMDTRTQALYAAFLAKEASDAK